jgi:hypothetical protein
MKIVCMKKLQGDCPEYSELIIAAFIDVHFFIGDVVSSIL